MNAATKKKLRANLVKARAALAAKRKAGWKPKKSRKNTKAVPTARVSALKKALEQEAVALEERAKKIRAAAELL